MENNKEAYIKELEQELALLKKQLLQKQHRIERLEFELKSEQGLNNKLKEHLKTLEFNIEEAFDTVRVPHQLIGRNSVKMSTKLYHLLEISRIENLYDLCLVEKSQLLNVRNFGKITMRELEGIMSHFDLEFANIASLNNSKIQSLDGLFMEIPVKLLQRRKENRFKHLNY